MIIEVSPVPKQPEKRKEKVVKLSVHKNNQEKRLKAEQKKIFKEYVKSVQESIPSPSGFAVVAWDEDNKSVAFIVDNINDIDVFPEKIKVLLTREINKYLDGIESGIEEEE